MNNPYTKVALVIFALMVVVMVGLHGCKGKSDVSVPPVIPVGDTIGITAQAIPESNSQAISYVLLCTSDGQQDIEIAAGSQALVYWKNVPLAENIVYHCGFEAQDTIGNRSGISEQLGVELQGGVYYRKG